MTWLTALWIVAIIVAIVAVIGIKPKGGKHIASTGLMGAARFVLFLMAVVIAYYAYHAR